jgi:hypothetical protein
MLDIGKYAESVQPHCDAFMCQCSGDTQVETTGGTRNRGRVPFNMEPSILGDVFMKGLNY